MAKRPAFQFYPSDWLNDLELRQCSPMSRGVWADLMCLMHDGEPYGHLSTKAGELTIPWLANRLGMRKGILMQCIAELEKFHVFSRNSSGIVHSRRMVRDEQLRVERAAGGPLSINNPNVPRPRKDTPQGYPEGCESVPSPSSSSSSSSPSSIKPEEQREAAQAPPAVSPDPTPALTLVKPKRERGSRFTLRPLPQEWAEYAMKKRGWTIEFTVEVFESFTNHWLASAQPGAVKRDWFAGWREWVTRERSPPAQPGLGFTHESHTDRAIRKGHELMREFGRL